MLLAIHLTSSSVGVVPPGFRHCICFGFSAFVFLEGFGLVCHFFVLLSPLIYEWSTTAVDPSTSHLLFKKKYAWIRLEMWINQFLHVKSNRSCYFFLLFAYKRIDKYHMKLTRINEDPNYKLVHIEYLV